MTHVRFIVPLSVTPFMPSENNTVGDSALLASREDRETTTRLDLGKNAFSLFLHNWKKYNFSHNRGQEHLATPDLPFLEWLVGFTEGDGCFFINNRDDLAFILIQGSSNLHVLETIQKKLGMGRIIKQGNRVFRLIVQKKDEVLLVIFLFNGNLVLPSRKAQFKRFFDCFLAHRRRVLPACGHGHGQ